MGPLRRGVIGVAALAPAPAFAQSCADMRPNWVPGTEVTAWAEAVALFSTPLPLILLVASALAFRLRTQWATVTVIVLWTLLVSLIVFTDAAGRSAAVAEGCIGSPSIFVGAVAVLCVALALYSAPREET